MPPPWLDSTLNFRFHPLSRNKRNPATWMLSLRRGFLHSFDTHRGDKGQKTVTEAIRKILNF